MNGGVLQRGRELAESLMTSRVRIRRRSVERTRNPETGREDYTWTVVYEGPARVREVGAQPQEADAAGQQVTDRAATVSLPISDHPGITAGFSSDVHVDDVGSLLENPDDPAAVGMEFRVRDGHVQTHSTASRLPVEVTSYAG